MASLLKNESLAAQFRGGMCILLRLTVDDYHRYCYVDSGVKGERSHSRLSSYRKSVAAEHAPIYKKTTAEYTVIDTAHFGKMIHMEVGALVVGKNHQLSRRSLSYDERRRKKVASSSAVPRLFYYFKR